MLCDSVYLLLYPYQKIRVWAFCVFLVDFYTMLFFLLFFQIVLPCHFFLLCDKKKHSWFEGKTWSTCGLVWDHKVCSVDTSSCLLHPNLNHVPTHPRYDFFFCQSLFLFFSFLFSFLVLLVCFCILFPCFRVLIFWIIFLIICYLVSCPNFLDNML